MYTSLQYKNIINNIYIIMVPWGMVPTILVYKWDIRVEMFKILTILGNMFSLKEEWTYI